MFDEEPRVSKEGRKEGRARETFGFEGKKEGLRRRRDGRLFEGVTTNPSIILIGP